jgi:hypothetical protein
MRRRSLKKDRNDEDALRNSRDRHLGISISNEFYQPVPMFFTREGSQLNLIGHYRGDSIFLICNGPSFVKLDHSKLKLPGIMTFGINNGPKTFRPDFWTCVDDPVRFLKSIWLDPKITKFVPQAHFEKPIFDNEKWEEMKMRVGECPNVVGYRRNEKFMADRFLFEDTFNWGCHKDYGGGRSVMLPAFRIAFLLGFRKLYLLGCDMKMTETYTYHFDEQRSKGAVNCNMGTYDRLKNDYLPALKPYFEKEGFQVFNCNPESELKVFPFKSFDDAIRDASQSLGDVKNERVWGMYSKPEEKAKLKQEPSVTLKPHLQTIEQLKGGSTVSESLKASGQGKQPIYVRDDCDPNTPKPPMQLPQTEITNCHSEIPRPVEPPKPIQLPIPIEPPKPIEPPQPSIPNFPSS